MAVNEAKKKLHRKQELLVDHGALDVATYDVNTKLTNLKQQNEFSPNAYYPGTSSAAQRTKVNSQVFSGKNGSEDIGGQNNMVFSSYGTESQPQVGMTGHLSSLENGLGNDKRTQSTAMLMKKPVYGDFTSAQKTLGKNDQLETSPNCEN